MGFINDKVPSSFWHLAIDETLARLKNRQHFNRIKKQNEQTGVLKPGDSGSYRFIMNSHESTGSQTLLLSLASIITDMGRKSHFPIPMLKTFVSTIS